MVEISLKINGVSRSLDVPDDMPLLWALRDKLNLWHQVRLRHWLVWYLHGAGNGSPVQACNIKAAALQDKEITTIEGLSPDGSHPVQRAWNDEDVPQCGYCQAGQVLAATALLARTPQPTDTDIDNAMAGILCRCGTYPRIRKAIKRAAGYMTSPGGES